MYEYKDNSFEWEQSICEHKSNSFMNNVFTNVEIISLKTKYLWIKKQFLNEQSIYECKSNSCENKVFMKVKIIP